MARPEKHLAQDYHGEQNRRVYHNRERRRDRSVQRGGRAEHQRLAGEVSCPQVNDAVSVKTEAKAIRNT